ncbi:nitric oxide reductase activation protein NorD, partial [Acidithiobacillus thiooxidans]
RHELRYWHIKGFSEPWQDAVYARLAALCATYSTRMGAALRHAGHYLSGQSADKRLLLILTDGQPADIDVDDPDYLLADTRRAVLELEEKGIFCHCISLDPHADEYVRKIFGNRFSIIDRVESLPERLPEIFISLTR